MFHSCTCTDGCMFFNALWFDVSCGSTLQLFGKQRDVPFRIALTKCDLVDQTTLAKM